MTDPTTTNPDDSKVGAELDEAAVATFKDSLRGELMGPDDLAYKDARMIWNRLIDKRPALIARCADANDVVRSVRFAREHELAVAVRGGGHNIAGNCVCDGGLMIDLSQMKGIQVDPEDARRAPSPGSRWASSTATHRFTGWPPQWASPPGWASPASPSAAAMAISPAGTAWLATTCSRWSGDRRGRAPERQRGRERRAVLGCARRRANFGVITSFEYRLHPVGKVLGGMVLYAPTRAALRFFEEFSSSCPDEVSTVGLLTTAPDGNLAFAIVACHCGPIDEGEKALAPLRSFGLPLADMLGARDYTDMQSMTDETMAPRAPLLLEVEPRAHAGRGGDRRVPGVRGPQAHRAVGDRHATAARRRGPPGHGPDGLPPPLRPLQLPRDARDRGPRRRGVGHRMGEAALGGDASLRRARHLRQRPRRRERALTEAYGPSLERLRALKNEYDPTNFFRSNS